MGFGIGGSPLGSTNVKEKSAFEKLWKRDGDGNLTEIQKEELQAIYDFYNRVRADIENTIVIDDPVVDMDEEKPSRITEDHLATSPATEPAKPYNKAVADVHRYLKEHVEQMPDAHVDGSVKEGVIRDLGEAIEKREGQKPWPVTLR
jgi:hypothetical protein